jgi:hypothetical protein
MILHYHYHMLIPFRSSKRARTHKLQPLLDQQFWCWGYDVRAKENWLLRYGFSRTRQPEPKTKGGSRYALKRTEVEIRLWGFGATVQSQVDGWTVLVSRYASKPHLCRSPVGGLDVHRIDDLPPFRAPATPEEEQAVAGLLGHFCAFVSDYETWVLAQAGESHRRHALDQWMHKPCCPAEEIPVRWKRLQQGTPS